MIRLLFDSASPADAVTLGPAPEFRMQGNFIRQGGAKGTIVARYKNHFWEVENKHYTSFECRDPCSVYFEDWYGGNSEVYGPFERLMTADGVVRTGQDQLLAKFIEETQLWHCMPTDTYWPAMVIESAQP